MQRRLRLVCSKDISNYAGVWAAFQNKPVRFFYMKPTDGYLHPAPLQDAARAVRTLRAKAKEWNIDSNRVVVVAFSSGGHGVMNDQNPWKQDIAECEL